MLRARAMPMNQTISNEHPNPKKSLSFMHHVRYSKVNHSSHFTAERDVTYRPTYTENLEINTIAFHSTKGKLDSKQKINKTKG